MRTDEKTSFYISRSPANWSCCYYIYIATTFAVIRVEKKVNMLTTKTTNLCHPSKRTWVYKAQSANHNWLECKQTHSGGSKRKSSARTIRLTARRSFPHVFITASSCIFLFKFDYRSSFYQLIIRSTPKTKEKEKKKSKYVHAWHTKNQTVRRTHKYIHKRIADGWKDRKKTGPAIWRRQQKIVLSVRLFGMVPQKRTDTHDVSFLILLLPLPFLFVM